MRRLPLVIHERLGNWARQLRPRFAAWPIRVVESRSASDLELALSGSSCPLVLIDLADRPLAGLDDLDRAHRAVRDALILVLDPGARPGLAPLARELGATAVVSGPIPPPAVVRLLARWMPLARRRREAEGWSADTDSAAELGDGPALLGRDHSPAQESRRP